MRKLVLIMCVVAVASLALVAHAADRYFLLMAGEESNWSRNIKVINKRLRNPLGRKGTNWIAVTRPASWRVSTNVSIKWNVSNIDAYKLTKGTNTMDVAYWDKVLSTLPFKKDMILAWTNNFNVLTDAGLEQSPGPP